MSKLTISEKLIAAAKQDGFVYVTRTSGKYSYAKNSNMRKMLEYVLEDYCNVYQLMVVAGAKKRYRSEGTELLIFCHVDKLSLLTANHRYRLSG